MSLYRMLQVLSISLFEEIELYELFSEKSEAFSLIAADNNAQLSFDELLPIE